MTLFRSGIAAVFLRDTGIRFRNIGWVCFATVLVTGTYNLWVRGVRFEIFTDAVWLGSSFGKTTVVKLLVFTLVLTISAIHDFILGPRATAAIAEDPASAYSAKLRRRASVLGRLNALLALVLLALGVMLVRGVPS